jgi:hypothetical protein
MSGLNLCSVGQTKVGVEVRQTHLDNVFERANHSGRTDTHISYRTEEVKQLANS